MQPLLGSLGLFLDDLGWQEEGVHVSRSGPGPESGWGLWERTWQMVEASGEQEGHVGLDP